MHELLQEFGHVIWLIRGLKQTEWLLSGLNLDYKISTPQRYCDLKRRIHTLEKRKHGEINGKEYRRQFHVEVALRPWWIAGAIFNAALTVEVEPT